MTSSSHSKESSADDIASLYYRVRAEVLRVPHNAYAARNGAVRHRVHFERLAELVSRLGIDPVLYLRAQVTTLRGKAYPNALYSDKAVDRYEDWLANERQRHLDPEKQEARLDKLASPPEDPVVKAVRDFETSREKVTKLLAKSLIKDRMLVALNNMYVLSPAYLIFLPTVAEGWESGTLGKDLANRISHYFAGMSPEEIVRFRYAVSRKPE